jgi:tetratricopeptide (TPR) repeat protein
MRNLRASLLAMLGAAMLAAPAFAQSPPKAPPTARDLAWGEVLFHHYQEDRMQALVRLAVAEQRAELPYHGGEAQLLRGGLYLAWGLRMEAAQIFEALLAGNASPAQQDQAWYWLGRIHHERGEHESAAAALARIGRHLPPSMAADRVDLEGRVLLSLGRYEEAARLLAKARQPGSWRPFADFNMAVALVRAGRAGEGLPVLDKLGASRTRDPELQILQDRANLALGLARLDAGDVGGARTALDRVRLDSPYASRALLAAGWAEADRGRFREALGPWTRLAELNDTDGAALEAMLAVPWAWYQLDESGASVLGYQRAAAACEAELVRLATVRELARGDQLLDAIVADAPGAVSIGPLGAYLHSMSADHPFRAVAADLRDLHQLRENLLEWRRSLGALRDMVDAGRARFLLVAPRVELRLEENELVALEARFASNESRMAELRAAADPEALVLPAERRLLARIGGLEQRIASLPAGPERDVLQERARRLGGALAWQLNHEWPGRLHEAERAQRAAARELEAARVGRQRLADSLAAGLERFAGFDARIDAAAARVEMLLARVEADHALRSDELRALAIEELDGRELRVAAYLGQARFALATAYDQALQSQAARGDASGGDVGTAP